MTAKIIVFAEAAARRRERRKVSDAALVWAAGVTLCFLPLSLALALAQASVEAALEGRVRR